VSVNKIIDLSAYQSNLTLIAKHVQPSRVMAVIKADGYGHGLVQSANAALSAGIDFLGVLDIETALTLRERGVYARTFAWLHSPQSNFSAAVRADVELSSGSVQELESIANSGEFARVHLKIDTGLSRNGCRIENWNELVTRAMEFQQSGIIEVVAIWSHLSGTSTFADKKALGLFEQASQIAYDLGFSGYRHIASSPAAFALPESRYDLVRIGVSAFGTSPLDGQSSASLGLKQAMRVEAEVLEGSSISIGFLHGYFSGLAGKSYVAIGGRSYRVLEVGPLDSIIEPGDYKTGDLVRIFGDDGQTEPTAEELCTMVGTVTDELFTGLKANSIAYSA
jgi:alanine racemase